MQLNFAFLPFHPVPWSLCLAASLIQQNLTAVLALGESGEEMMMTQFLCRGLGSLKFCREGVMMRGSEQNMIVAEINVRDVVIHLDQH